MVPIWHKRKPTWKKDNSMMKTMLGRWTMEQFLPTGQEALVTEGEVNEGQELKLH